MYVFHHGVCAVSYTHLVVGEMKPYDEKTGIIYWDIPFRAGAVSYTHPDVYKRQPPTWVTWHT